MKQQFLVGDVVKLNQLGLEAGNRAMQDANHDLWNSKYILMLKSNGTSVVSRPPSLLDEKVWLEDNAFFVTPEHLEVVERAWQKTTGVQMVDEDTYIQVLFEGSTSLSVVIAEKEWWENTKGMVKWCIADEYENPEAFFEQEQSAEAQPPVGVALGEELVAVDTQKKNKYTREIKPNVFVDVYDVLRAFNVSDPCLSHLCKKALCAGLRGHKDRLTDLQDIKASIERAIEMHIEWEK